MPNPQEALAPLPTVDEIQVEEAVIDTPELALEIDDDDLLAIIDRKIADSRRAFKDRGVEKRSEKMVNYWLGKQHDEDKYYDYQDVYTNNILHRDLETSIAIAAGRMPDILVLPDDPNDDDSIQDAHEYEQFLNAKVNSDITKRLMKKTLRKHKLNLIACIKIRWDENRGPNGDIAFESINNKNLQFDHTATIPDDGYTSDNMEYVSEWIEEPLSLVCAKFPKKAQALLQMHGIADGNQAPMSKMVSKIRYRETWATWYDREGQRLEIVFWHYRTLVLDKCKSPYWDWKEERNHFDMPRKPYMFASFESMDNGPHDDTNNFEQSMFIQDTVNKRGMQITEINDNLIPKKVVSGDAMDKKDAENMTGDPKEVVWLKAGVDISKAFTTYSTAAPDNSLYQDQQGLKNDIDANMATHSITRGEAGNDDMSGVAKQITREGDLTIADDVVEIVVQRLVSEMANWATQLMMVQYFDPNEDKQPADSDYDFGFKPWSLKQPGKNGDFKQLTITRAKIRQGINVMVNSNTIDKATRRNLAVTLMQSKAIDPYTLADWLDIPDPKGFATKLALFLSGSQSGFATYLSEIGVDVTKLGKGGPEADSADEETPTGAPGQQGEQASPDQDQQQANQDIQSIVQGQIPQPPEPPSTDYVKTIEAFVQSPNFKSLPDEAKQALMQYIDLLHQEVDKAMSQPQQGAPAGQPPAPGAPVDGSAMPPVQ